MPVRRSRSARSSVTRSRKTVGELVERLTDRGDLVLAGGTRACGKIARRHVARNVGHLQQAPGGEPGDRERGDAPRREGQSSAPIARLACTRLIASSTSVRGSAMRAVPIVRAVPAYRERPHTSFACRGWSCSARCCLRPLASASTISGLEAWFSTPASCATSTSESPATAPLGSTNVTRARAAAASSSASASISLRSVRAAALAAARSAASRARTIRSPRMRSVNWRSSALREIDLRRQHGDGDQADREQEQLEAYAQLHGPRSRVAWHATLVANS